MRCPLEMDVVHSSCFAKMVAKICNKVYHLSFFIANVLTFIIMTNTKISTNLNNMHFLL